MIIERGSTVLVTASSPCNASIWCCLLRPDTDLISSDGHTSTAFRSRTNQRCRSPSRDTHLSCFLARLLPSASDAAGFVNNNEFLYICDELQPGPTGEGRLLPRVVVQSAVYIRYHWRSL